MRIYIAGHKFHGPFEDFSSLRDQPGVYVILGKHGDSWNVVDVGESVHIKTRINNHEREICWRRQGYAKLSVAVFCVNGSSRMTIETQIRNQYNPPCGAR